MINKEEVKNDFIKVFSAFENSIHLFDDQNFNTVPFAESWTPGQVVRHVVLASDGFEHILKGEVKDTERPFDELKPRVKADFLNFGIKMKSPDFILPKMKDYDKEQLTTKIRSIKEAIVHEIDALDLTKTCLGFEIPGYGFFTRYEAIYFVIYHTQRHNHQLNEIYRFLKIA
ncbi:DinB family protein [Pedobacter polaris]|uniref:DinB family protein n=1 Tax=Pedobacter polaris TaxID=2571273 RepID=A0A4U1CK45_9SPHI|nr:DinB family protein [Pedobacter polaris]TKC06559.1 DinB family protein [Pedobacter polaris]